MKPLVFTSRTAAALWWFILIFYACNVMFLLMLAVVYFNYSDPLSWLNLMAFNLLYTESVVFLQKYHVLIGSLYVLLTLPSLHGIFQMLARCIRKVKSSSGPRQTQLTRMTTVRMILSRGAGGFAATVKAAINSVGMRGKYFTPFLFAIETVEIALQTWQAYRTSRYISNLRINVLYGIAIFINCWSTAVIHYVWEHKRHHPLMARFLSVLVDAILDFAWGVVLQGVLVWRLAFENCTELEIPATIREFTGLGTIAIRNSSLLEWENDAVVNATFTTLQTLQFLHVHVSCVPRGIMNEPLPWSLEWVRLEWISGEPFYSHVSVAWQSLVFFTCIGCDLTTIPAVANNMSRLVFYQFTNNSLVTIPTTPFLNKSDLSYVLLSGNPIEQLPDSVWDLLNQLYWLDIRGTNILDIPSDRVATAPSIKIFAFGSPLCATNSSLIGSKVSCDEYSMMS
ncbi:TPA: hypothetical protein N0F65_011177 [Lagenidium giganteum]|uniref:Uncharacterized protein n=1 Tax=Lagenidium giganteum TaxID=4803 RepID=A0AAV2Z8H7_9STRA|nr:TPA: hypothetical protein N0F65_011177 [Lagenidium giganteum]